MAGGGFRKRPGNKVVPYFSHEFVIQNHGDIVTCMCMVFIVGLMFQTTAPYASAFVAPKHNVTEITDNQSGMSALYTYGYKDFALYFFYTLVAIIFHAVIQEYVLDKLMRKIRLSKTKANKFNESGQLLAFYLVSIVCAVVIFRDESYFQSFNFFWNGYPHAGLTFFTKLFFVLQIAYWLHMFPEIYFQKVKKEDVMNKVVFGAVNLFICASIYYLNLTRIGMTLLFIEYFVNTVFHVSRILYFSGKNQIARISFTIYNIIFVLARLTGIILSVFVFWFGFKSSSVDSIDFKAGNFNTPLVRLTCLGGSLLVQAWMMWNFILFQCKKIRENSKPLSSTSKTAVKTNLKKNKSSRSESESDAEIKEPNGEVLKQKSN